MLNKYVTYQFDKRQWGLQMWGPLDAEAIQYAEQHCKHMSLKTKYVIIWLFKA